LARDVLHDRDGALAYERDRHRVGTDALARDAAGGVETLRKAGAPQKGSRMAESEPGTGPPHYDREFLLSPGKRNQMMALWEVQKFGSDSFGDPDYVSIYGMRPAEWYARGVRLLARTTLEAVRPTILVVGSRPPGLGRSASGRHARGT
jgi:hypothetical protein